MSQITCCPSCGTKFKVVADQLRISEGWVRVALGKKVDRHGQPLTIKLTGETQAFYRDAGKDAADEGASEEGEQTDK